jgi:hypothetical protein
MREKTLLNVWQIACIYAVVVWMVLLLTRMESSYVEYVLYALLLLGSALMAFAFDHLEVSYAEAV